MTFKEWWKSENPEPWQNAEYEAWAMRGWEAALRWAAELCEASDKKVYDSGEWWWTQKDGRECAKAICAELENLNNPGETK